MNADKAKSKYRTPSDSPFPVFVLAQPCFVSDDIENNPWMKNAKGKEAEPIDVEKFMAQWYNFYNLLSSNSLVYLLPPKKGLQDLTYVNCFMYVAHQPEKNLIILSNFTAEGRAGEEVVAMKFLTEMGYKCVKPPFKFEGFPELKHLRENIYFGGYGFRTDLRFHHWFERNYKAEVFKIKEKDELQYHLDCNVFVLDEENIILSVETTDKAVLKEIEKVCNVFPVSDDDAWEDICNIVRVGDLIIGATSIQSMKKSDPVYKKQEHKNQTLEKICNKMGLELAFVDLSELSKSGAACSCLATPLTVKTY